MAATATKPNADRDDQQSSVSNPEPDTSAGGLTPAQQAELDQIEAANREEDPEFYARMSGKPSGKSPKKSRTITESDDDDSDGDDADDTLAFNAGSSKGRTLRGRLSGNIRNNKKKWAIGLAIGGILGGGIIGLLLSFAGIFRLNLYQETMSGHYERRMRRIYGVRTNKFITELIKAEIAGNVNGENIYFSSRGFDLEHPIRGAYRTLVLGGSVDGELTKFQEYMRTNHGFQYARVADGNGVQIDRLVRIKNLDIEQELRQRNMVNESRLREMINEAGGGEFDDYVETIFDPSTGRREIYGFVDELETLGYRYWQRMIIRGALRDALGVSRWRFFEDRREERRQDRSTKQVKKEVHGGMMRRTSKFFLGEVPYSCVFSLQNCPESINPNNRANRNLHTRTTSGDYNTAGNEAIDELEDVTGEPDAPATLRRQVADAVGGRVGELGAKEIGKFTVGQAATFFTAKVIPVVNLIDFIINAGELITAVEDGALLNLYAMARTAEYGEAGALINTQIDQATLGENTSADEINAVNEIFNGFEYSDMWQDAAGNPRMEGEERTTQSDDYGYQDVTEELKVNGTPNGFFQFADFVTNTYVPIVGPLVGRVKNDCGDGGGIFDQIFDVVQAVGSGGPVGAANALLNCVTGSFVSDIWLTITGFIGDTTQNILFFFSDDLLNLGLEELISRVGSWVFNLILAPVCLSPEGGPRMSHCYGAGLKVASELALGANGAAPVNPERAAASEEVAYLEAKKEWQGQSLRTKLADLDDPRSVAGQLVLSMPVQDTTVQGSYKNTLAFFNPERMLNSFASIPSTLSRLVSNSVFAQENDGFYYVNRLEVQENDFPEGVIDDSELFGGLSPEECQEEIDAYNEKVSSAKDVDPDGDPEDPNTLTSEDYSICKFDRGTVDTVVAHFTEENDGGINSYETLDGNEIGSSTGGSSALTGDLSPGGNSGPPPNGWPSDNNTGPQSPAGLQRYSGGGNNFEYRITQSNITLDGYYFDKCVIVEGNNVTISNSYIECRSTVWALGEPASGARPTGQKYLNNTIVSGDRVAAGVHCGNCEVRGNNISGSHDGIKGRSNAQFIGNYIHDLAMVVLSSGPTHNDGFQLQAGNNIVIRGNSFIQNCAGQGRLHCNGGIFLGADSGNISNILIDNNYLRGWGTAVHVDPKGKSIQADTVNNTFSNEGRLFAAITYKPGSSGLVACNESEQGGFEQSVGGATNQTNNCPR